MNTYDPEPKYTDTNFELNLDLNVISKAVPILTYTSKDLIIVDNFISNEISNNIINWIDNETTIESVHKVWSQQNLNKKKLCRNWNDCYLLSLLDKILSYLPETIIENSDTWKKSYVNTSWRFVRSNGGSSLKPHFDMKYVKSVDECSYYTVMIYLSDHESDGQLHILDKKLLFHLKEVKWLFFIKIYYMKE